MRSTCLPLLTSQTRAQVRRAQREARGLEIDVAHDEPSARAIYSELVTLHQRQWTSRGEPGAFADPWFDSFHNDSRSSRARNIVHRRPAERLETRTPNLPKFGIGHRLYVEIREIGDWADIVVIVNSRHVSPNDPLVLASAIERLLTTVAGGADGAAVTLMADALDECAR